MEKLVPIVMAVCLGSLAVCLGGLWLLHSALNAGNVWMGIVAVTLTIAGGSFFVVTIPAFRP